ncbi:MAG: LLM class flavin-dependent oxidoreductase [Actinomycetota bacterium]|nr:LLM class flavin-dependent oxidoreductase [Actinomycetota bacterium]
MKVGIGLPSAVPGAPADVLLEWARRADAGSFSSLGVVDRVLYDSYEPMTTLAAAAAITMRIGLVTMVVIGPLRNNSLLAKEAATVDALSNGRLTLGVGLGARADDYEGAGVPTSSRGDALTEQLADLRSVWEGQKAGPMRATGERPRLLVGGTSDLAFLRVAKYADGYVHGGGPPRTFATAAGKARTAWADLGRTGSPSLWAQAYFALGDSDVVATGRDYMLDYYGFTGPFATRIAEGMLSSSQAVAQFVRGYAEAGCDELVLLPAVADLEQIDRLQEALGEA